MTNSHHSYVISEEDWSLHRKGYDDQKRHKERVKEAIKKNLQDLITEENIILSDGRDVVKIPIRSLDEYKIRFNHEKRKHVGQGNGKAAPGDVVARSPQSPNKAGAGSGAGDEKGEDITETDVSILEIAETLFSELELPNLKQKDDVKFDHTKYQYNDIRRVGLIGNIDKKRTMIAAFKRNSMNGEPKFHPILKEDLRFKTWNEVEMKDSNAVIFALMDTSGSMGKFEKYVARSFFFWMTKFLRTKYEHVEIEFIAHHTEAKSVSEDIFFNRGESGGTICSSAYELALKLLDEKYPVNKYNAYVFHFSDGDNLSSDNERCHKLIEEILERANMFGYGEVNQYSRNTTLMSTYRKIQTENFSSYVLKNRTDVLSALKHFFYKK